MDAILIGFVIYLVFILGLGIYASRQTKNMKDFALGGQRLGPKVIALSERASGESAWLLLGLPGAALTAGMLELWTVVGCITGIMFSWLVIAKPLRILTEKLKVLTLPELFEQKFNEKSGIIRLVASLIITFFFTFYVAAQFSGAGKVLNVTFGITHMQGMLLGALIIIFYTLLGGFFAVAWTDMVQGIIMIGTLVILPLVGWIELSHLPEKNIVVWDMSNLWGGKTGGTALLAAIGGLSWGLGYMGQPHLVTRFMAIDSVDNISQSRRIAFAWAIPAFFGAMIIGLVGVHLVSAGILPALSDSEFLMPTMAKTLLPTWLAGIFISGAIAAMMSTTDSQLLISTTVLTQDIYKRFSGLKTDDKTLLRIGRILTIIIGFIGFGLAWQSKDLVFEMVSYAWGGLGASFGPALLLTLWWKRTSIAGILVGMVCGTLFTIWDIAGETVTPRLTAFLIAFLAVVVVSYINPNKEDNLSEYPLGQES